MTMTRIVAPLAVLSYFGGNTYAVAKINNQRNLRKLGTREKNGGAGAVFKAGKGYFDLAGSERNSDPIIDISSGSPPPTPGPAALATPIPTPGPVPLSTPLPTPGPAALVTPMPTPGPTALVTPIPTPGPAALVTPVPTPGPAALATLIPTPGPAALSTPIPTPGPAALVTPIPTPGPAALVTPNPTPGPSPQPSPGPTLPDTPNPTSNPTPFPTAQPTSLPTPVPTPLPTPGPTSPPTRDPTKVPTFNPTPDPTPLSSPGPTFQPTPAPTDPPTLLPTVTPTSPPTKSPTGPPSSSPSIACLQVDSTVYQCGAAISVDFFFEDPLTNDWIGIYPCDQTQYFHAMVWQWACGSQGCIRTLPARTNGTLVFDRLPTYNNVGPHKWPVKPYTDGNGDAVNCFEAVYLRADGPSTPPYIDLCTSNRFTIEGC